MSSVDRTPELIDLSQKTTAPVRVLPISPLVSGVSSRGMEQPRMMEVESISEAMELIREKLRIQIETKRTMDEIQKALLRSRLKHVEQVRRALYRAEKRY